MSNKNTIGKKIAQLRKEHKIGQDEFAYRIGVSRQTASWWETGQRIPRADKIDDICKEFGVEPNYFYSSDAPDKEVAAALDNGESPPQKEAAQPQKKSNKKIAAVAIVAGLILLAIAIFIMVVCMIILSSESSNNITAVRTYHIDYLQLSIIGVVIFSCLFLVLLFVAIKHFYKKAKKRKNMEEKDQM